MKLTIAVRKKLGEFQLDVTFCVSGGITVLFGPSGCGKSSTLALLAGLQPPDSGQIVFGETLFVDSESHINLPPQKRQVGYVFQDYAIFPHLTVRKNICFGIDHLSTNQQQQRLTELLALLQLESLIDRYPHQLSGGQQQRVALARALAPQPRLLLLDEPFSALEAQLRTQLQEELERIQHQLNLPIVMVTHSRAEALLLADTVVQLQQGQVVGIGKPVDILITDNESTPHYRYSW